MLHVTVTPHAEAPPQLGAWLDDLRITPEEIAAELHLPQPPPAVKRSAEPRRLIEVEQQAPAAAPAILQYVIEHDIDLVVMGTHGRHGLRRVVLGSVAEEVVRRAPCPVFTVNRCANVSSGIRRIVAPVDASAPAREAARYAKALATLYGARLDLLYVIDVATRPEAHIPFVGPFEGIGLGARQRAQAALQSFADELGADGVKVEVGMPVPDILDVAKRTGADLLVLGSHGRSGMERLLLGSVAERVIRQAPCPVFTVKTFGKALLEPGDRGERALLIEEEA